MTKIVDQKKNDAVNVCIVDGGINHVNYYGQNMAMKTPILSVTLAVANDVRGSIEAALGDIAEAGRVTGPIAFTAPAAAEGEDEAADVTVAESELGEPPAKKPKK